MFYFNMFVPHIKARFGELSRIDSHDEMSRAFAQGFLLLVLEGNCAVAGALCIVRDESLIFRRTGVLDGNEEYIKKGAQQALYYFMISYAQENGLKCVDSMKSRPFPNDGLYRTKRAWGASVFPDDESGNWVYYFNPCASDKMSKFLELFPTIAFTPQGLKVVAGVTAEAGPSVSFIDKLKAQYYSPGLESLILYDPAAHNATEYPFRDDIKR